MSKTPQMLNWLCRYAPVRRELLDGGGQLRASLLDVGSGPHGFACASPDAPFVGMDMMFPLPAGPTMVGIKNEPGRFPFADASFGTVISLDTLEHVPPADRAAFVAEMARVSAGATILACPSSEMAEMDDLVREMFVMSGRPVPEWLSEHDDYGLPTPEEIEACTEPPPGFTRRPLGMPNGLLATMATLADMIAQTEAAARFEATWHSDQWLDLFAGAPFGESGRKGWVLERIDPLEPLVDNGRLEETTLAALRCQACESPFERDGSDLLRCTGCGAHARFDPALRVWDLATAPAAPAPRRTYWCEPSWRAAELAPLLHGFADLDDPNASLVLRAAPGKVDSQAALRCAVEALGGRELAPHVDVVVLTDALAPEAEHELRAGATVIEAGSFAGFTA